MNMHDAQRALRLRGIRVLIRDLGKRTNGELADAIAWAEMCGPLHTAPAWLRHWIDTGRARPIGGTCLACGCTDAAACEGGCTWVDAHHTLCSECTTTKGMHA